MCLRGREKAITQFLDSVSPVHFAYPLDTWIHLVFDKCIMRIRAISLAIMWTMADIAIIRASKVNNKLTFRPKIGPVKMLDSDST